MEEENPKTTHDIQVFSPDEKFTTVINNVPKDIKVKEFLELISKIPELEKLDCELKIKYLEGCLDDEDVINEDVVYLIKAEQLISPARKNHKSMIFVIFWVLQISLVISIFYHRFLLGLIIYLIGSVILWLLKQFNPENTSLTADLIDGFRLFFSSADPRFNLEDAIKK